MSPIKTMRRSFPSDQSGSIAMMSALILPVAIGASAFAVDLASAYLDRRATQGAADLAAMAAANQINIAEEAARATLRANGLSDIKTLVVTKGRYDANAAIPVEDRFHANAEPFNAVKLEVGRETPMYLARIFGAPSKELAVTAIGAAAAEASFSVGSRLAAVRDGALNAVLGGLLGGTLDLSVMDYEALVDMNVRIDDFLGAMATELDLTGVTFNDVLASRATVANVANALVSLGERDGKTEASAALGSVLSRSNAARLAVPLQKMFDLGPYGGLSVGQQSPGLGALVDAMGMLRAAAVLANGAHQVAIDVGADLPGLAKVRVDLTIGEPEQYSGWVSVGARGATIRTAQFKLRVRAELLGSGLLGGASIKLPLYVEAAYAEATLANVTCADPDAPAQATIAVRPGIARAAIAEVSDSMMKDARLWQRLPAAELVKLAALKITGKSEIDLGNRTATDLTFTEQDVADGTIKRADTNDYLGAILSSLLGKLDVDVETWGLSLLPSRLVAPALIEQLSTVARPVDGVVHSILSALGVHLGEADVKVHGIRCGRPVLAG